MDEFIPFNKIFRGQEEIDAVIQVLKSDCWRGDGPAGREAEAFINEWLGSKYTFLTTSCTHALEMAMMILDIGPGDEVIMPGFTFVSTANAVRTRGAMPVFADIRPLDLMIDPEDVEKKTTSKTKAIVPVHYSGISADFDGLFSVINPSRVTIVEDAAQGVGARWKGRALGTIGEMGCFSFHDTKNFTSGEGGAFLTQCQEIAEKAEWIREKGTNRSAFMRGEVDKYTWISSGSSYIPSDILSAVLMAQLKKKDAIVDARKTVWESYRASLQEAENKGWITLPVIPSYSTSNYHMFYFLTKRKADRNPLLDVLKKAGIDATFHYIPLHNSPYAKKISRGSCTLPATEELAESIIRLPLYPDLATNADKIAGRVSEVIHSYFLNH
ncbi:dTDP-4-amino-4,6-dideoxygalactose transaminase [Balneolaceae bacterium ANBcel3]|nr:dTDP-4-amino-4,6-dideoxygalactose transaminase [Balneolaceae bacterium ANBcel3]